MTWGQAIVGCSIFFPHINHSRPLGVLTYCNIVPPLLLASAHPEDGNIPFYHTTELRPSQASHMSAQSRKGTTPFVFVWHQIESQPSFSQLPPSSLQIHSSATTTLNISLDVANQSYVTSPIPAARRFGDSPFVLPRPANATVFILAASTHLQRHPAVGPTQ